MKKTENLRKHFVLLLVIFITFSCFTVLFAAKPQPSDNNQDEKAPVEDFKISKKQEDNQASSNKEEEQDGEEEEEEEEHEPTPEEIAAQEAAEAARLEALQKKGEKLTKELEEIGKDDSAIIDFLSQEENIDAVYENAYLLERLLEAHLNSKKPNYNLIKRYGESLARIDRKSSIANYAQALYFMNARKPDYKKAMLFLDNAKKAKKPYKNVSSAYFTCVIKRFLIPIILIFVLIIVLIVFLVIKIIKKKKQSQQTEIENSESTSNPEEIDLQKLLDETPSNNVEKKEINETNNNVSSNNVIPQEKEIDKNTEINNNLPKTPVIPTPSSQEIKAESLENNDLYKDNSENQKQEKINSQDNNISNIETSEPNKIQGNSEATKDSIQTKTEIDSSSNKSSTNSTPVKKVVRVVKKVRVRKDADGNSYVISEDTSTKNISESDNQQQIQQTSEDLNSIRNITKINNKPLPPVDSQLDILWENLSRKALQGHIGLMARKSETISSSLSMPNSNNINSYNPAIVNDNNISDIRFGDVSIDLSEEALKEDLVGKLKMLAITDSELRELFALKNPAHIPYLIEYIMTKPEPIRLAFVAKELGNYSDPAVIDTLSSLLYNEDERVVLAAIQGLEATKSPAAVIPLCPFLRSEIPLYAQAARTALSKFGAVKIMQALKDLPTFTDIKLKEAGIFVLSRMKGEPVEKILKTLLGDESSSVRIQAILAMSYQKNPVYIDALRDFYRIANDTEKSMTRKAIVYLNGFNKQ